MMTKTTFMLIASCVIGSFVLLAATNLEVEAEKVINETSITGTVVDATTREGIPGAEVILQEGESTSTDEYGSFYFSDVEVGTHNITAEAVNYRPAQERVEVTEEGATIEIQLDPEYE